MNYLSVEELELFTVDPSGFNEMYYYYELVYSDETVVMIRVNGYDGSVDVYDPDEWGWSDIQMQVPRNMIEWLHRNVKNLTPEGSNYLWTMRQLEDEFSREVADWIDENQDIFVEMVDRYGA